MTQISDENPKILLSKLRAPIYSHFKSNAGKIFLKIKENREYPNLMKKKKVFVCNQSNGTLSIIFQYVLIFNKYLNNYNKTKLNNSLL